MTSTRALPPHRRPRSRAGAVVAVEARLKHLILPLAVLSLALLPAHQARAEPPATRPDLPQATEGPPEGLPTPDTFVRDALRHPPADAKARAETLDGLYQRLAAAESVDTAKPVAQAIERVWRASGSATTDLLLARATEAIETQRYDLALALLNSAIELQPEFAETWNRRAFVYHLRDEPQRALSDLRQVLALDPKHYRALEGLGVITRSLGEQKAALGAYKKLLEVYPLYDGAAKTVDELTVEVEGQGI